MATPLSLQSVCDLVSAWAIRLAVIEAYGCDFSIGFDIGMERRPLASQRDPVWLFKTVEAALRVL